MNRQILLWSFYVFICCSLSADNLIKGGHFDFLRNDNMPIGSSWEWLIRGSKEVKYFLDTTEKHNGLASLRIVDEYHGKKNDGLNWMMAGNLLQNFSGKQMQLSCWIKQIKTTKAGAVGISYWIKRKNGIIQTKHTGPESTGETLWTKYSLTFTVPDDAQVLMVFIGCASGWGVTGEALFDDLTLETVDKSVKKDEKIKYMSSSRKRMFYIYDKKLLTHWKTRSWGELYIEHIDDEGVLKIATVKGAKKYSGISLYSPYANRNINLSNAPQDSALFITLTQDIPLQINFAGTKISIFKSMYRKIDDAYWEIAIPLKRFTGDKKDCCINELTIQLPAELDKGGSFLIKTIGISEIPDTVSGKVKTELKNKAENLCGNLKNVWTSDPYERPEIRKGTFYLNNRPLFLLGPWIASGSLLTEYGAGKERECMRGKIYDEIYNPSIAAELGMNSFQLSAAMSSPALFELDLPWSKGGIDQAEAWVKMFRDLKGMYFVQDFAWINAMAKPAIKEYGKEIEQHNFDWHEFIPLCPEHPVSDKIYETYFRTGTAFTLAHGGNPFIYEIFNESSYMCSCKFNRDSFVQSVSQRYKTIAAANRTWQTSFQSFSELSTIPRYENVPALWAEWCEFMGERYAAILRKYGMLIKKVDQRKNVYITEQLAMSTILGSRGAGMDYRLIAAELDLLAVEGGWHFGHSSSNGTNPMEDALNSSAYSFACDFYSAVTDGKKPVIDNEHYCSRYSLGKRVPSKRTDIYTALWGSVFHGLSGSYSYAWGKRIWEWKTFEEAKAMVINGGYKASHLLNPYSWPREALNGYKDFSDEIADIAELVLPMPRRAPAKVALIFSYPSLRMSAINGENHEKQLLNSYHALLYSQYNPAIIFDEELSFDKLKSFDAVILPSVRNTSEKVIAELSRYVKAGGILICAGKALSENKFGQPIDSLNLLGLKRQGDQIICKSAKKSGAFWMNKLGKGTCCYLQHSFDKADSATEIPFILKQFRVGRYFSLSIADNGTGLTKAEIQIIDRGQTKLLFIVNWEDMGTRLVKLLYEGKEQLPDMNLSFISTGERYLGTKKGSWTDSDLREGVVLTLPPQTAVVIVLSGDSNFSHSGRNVTETQVRKRFSIALAKEKSEYASIKEQEKLLHNKNKETREFNDVKKKQCRPLDLKRYANTNTRDDLSGDRKGGWFDQGNNDYRKMPKGKIPLAGVPFDIIDPVSNNQKNVIVLRGSERKYFPSSVNGIEVNAKASRIYLLHTAGWSQQHGTACYYVKLNYADGTSEELPVLWGQDIGGWWKPTPIKNGKIAHEIDNAVCSLIGLYCGRLMNPHPEFVIKSIDLKAGQNNAVPAIVAITIE
ncbi:MAG: beta-galactosidase [Victivallales bacterium]|nr:beta-galactosidase [Victivallales bacterium]